ncbi:hypothetical protein [Leptospira semungkisensis]|uniref:hypothetical protein n=1 Tax=Leptospira semungkisensis TaxID=2484985 RepID=UPI001FE9DD7C|nr:hypothetical protein [Leptospira semungkisensis]
MSEKTCSSQDRGCNSAQQVLSLFSAPSGVYVYPTSTSYQGNLSILGAGALDSSLSVICGRDKLLAPIIDLGCSKVAPMVSTSLVSFNAINTFYADIPYTGTPVRGPKGGIIADDLSTLFASDLKMSLSAAGLGIGGQLYWSFSDGSGSVSSDTCNDGGDNTGAYNGAVGSTTISAVGSWFNVNSASCSESHRVLCLCYHPLSSSGG